MTKSAKNPRFFEPSFKADHVPTRKSLFIRELCQKGKVLHNYWMHPTQRNLQEAAAAYAFAAVKAGQSERQIAEVFHLLSIGNASQMKQFINATLERPDGEIADTPSADLSDLEIF